MERKTERQLICGKHSCQAALRAGFGGGRYWSSSVAVSPSKTADFIGSKTAPKPDRTPLWRVAAAGTPIAANQYHCAAVGADEALVAADRINAAHWRAAKGGECGYRKPGATRFR